MKRRHLRVEAGRSLVGSELRWLYMRGEMR